MKSPEEIVGLLRERESNLEPSLARMRRVRAAYDGDIVVPLPELDDHEQVAVANLLAQGLDQTAMRIASVMPDVVMPPVAAPCWVGGSTTAWTSNCLNGPGTCWVTRLRLFLSDTTRKPVCRCGRFVTR